MLMPHTRALIVGAAVLAAVLGFLFYRRQNQQAGLGGRISAPKIAWLMYAVFAWFLLCPLLAQDPAVPPACRWIFGLFGASMWLRGAAEMYLLYGVRRWRPPYGIAHDAFCLVLILAMAVAAWPQSSVGSTAGAYWAFVGVMVASLGMEILYAALFFQAVHGRTTGEAGVWFADEDERFQRINRITAAFNVLLFASTAIFLGASFGLWERG